VSTHYLRRDLSDGVHLLCTLRLAIGNATRLRPDRIACSSGISPGESLGVITVMDTKAGHTPAVGPGSRADIPGPRSRRNSNQSSSSIFEDVEMAQNEVWFLKDDASPKNFI